MPDEWQIYHAQVVFMRGKVSRAFQHWGRSSKKVTPRSDVQARCPDARRGEANSGNNLDVKNNKTITSHHVQMRQNCGKSGINWPHATPKFTQVDVATDSVLNLAKVACRRTAFLRPPSSTLEAKRLESTQGLRVKRHRAQNSRQQGKYGSEAGVT